MSFIPTRGHGITGRGPAMPDSAARTGHVGVGALAGLGLLAGLGSAVITLLGQARSATRTIEEAAIEAALADGTLVPPPVPGGTRAQQRKADHLVQVRLPQGEGVYGPDGGMLADAEHAAGYRGRHGDRPLTLALLGDSTSVGYGTQAADELPGVIVARGLAADQDRPVRLISLGLTGARTSDLPGQLDHCLLEQPDIVVILVGANDLRDLVPPSRSAAQLGSVIATLSRRGIPVIAGTCPDFSVITAIPQPLRSVVGTWSLRLAALQERAVTAAGGIAVPLARLVSPQFVGNPEMFARDHFHPSGAGYERAMAVVLPAAIRALGSPEGNIGPSAPHQLSA
jgi:lysophospholipase L1-like esterase